MKTRKIGQFDGYGGTKRETFEFETNNVVLAHSCLLPEFWITLRIGELRAAIKDLDDGDAITVTVTSEKAAKFTFVR